MTEAEWLASNDLELMLIALNNMEIMYPPEEQRMARKARLFCCACCRHVEHLLPDPHCREVLARVERYADGLMTYSQWREMARPIPGMEPDLGG
jgi:hypothetical protein